jgi:DNA topoisomerase-3
MFETETHYVCERFQAEKKPCRFKVSRVILQQPIDHVQLGKVLSARKTDLINGFISKAGKPFAAYLVMDESSGKITFEFPARDDVEGPS